MEKRKLNMIRSFNTFKLNEYKGEEFKNNKKIAFLDKLFKDLSDKVMTKLPDDFDLIYDKENFEMSIKTNNPLNYSAFFKIKDDTFIFADNSAGEIPFEIELSFNYLMYNQIFKLFDDSVNMKMNNLFFKPKETKKTKFETVEKIDKLEKPKNLGTIVPPKYIKDRVKRSINKNIIKLVLHDADKRNEIIIGDITIDELIRRMEDLDKR